jgi:hypothetical protein
MQEKKPKNWAILIVVAPKTGWFYNGSIIYSDKYGFQQFFLFLLNLSVAAFTPVNSACACGNN